MVCRRSFSLLSGADAVPDDVYLETGYACFELEGFLIGVLDLSGDISESLVLGSLEDLEVRFGVRFGV